MVFKWNRITEGKEEEENISLTFLDFIFSSKVQCEGFGDI